MKQRLEPDDLLELSASQKNSLRDLWRPQIFDLVLAEICVDVENDSFQYHLFVIGNISVHQSHHGVSVLLKDLRKITGTPPAEEAITEETEADSDSDIEPVFDENSFASPEYQFDQYLKDDCLPLLTIGQMIEILQKLSYGDNFFNLTIPLFAGENYILSRDGYAEEYESEELWQILWECIKEKL